MVTGEFHSYQEAEDPFEAEETLSLSDLPISGDSAQFDDSYSKYSESSSVNDDFEFFSEDFTAATRSTTVEKDIIFCGRIINAYGGESKKNVAKQSKSLNQKVNNISLPWISNKSDPKSDVPSDYSVGTMKNGWYLYTFGMSSMKSPPEMDSSDNKSSQIRRSFPATTTAFPAPAGGNKSQGRRKSWWLGKMLRSLGSGRRNSGIVISSKTTP